MTGKVVEIDLVFVRPFGLGELLSTRSEGNEGLSLKVQGSRIRVDDEALEGWPTVNTTITFHERLKPFVLVPEGWVPLALLPVHNFLIDRNILSLLRKLSSCTLRDHGHHSQTEEIAESGPEGRWSQISQYNGDLRRAPGRSHQRCSQKSIVRMLCLAANNVSSTILGPTHREPVHGCFGQKRPNKGIFIT
tara:strand:+ start:276 stop:848 length:573 start_codon:yes stop_codon:yes gene_type:complete